MSTTSASGAFSPFALLNPFTDAPLTVRPMTEQEKAPSHLDTQQIAKNAAASGVTVGAAFSIPLTLARTIQALSGDARTKLLTTLAPLGAAVLFVVLKDGVDRALALKHTTDANGVKENALLASSFVMTAALNNHAVPRIIKLASGGLLATAAASVATSTLVSGAAGGVREFNAQNAEHQRTSIVQSFDDSESPDEPTPSLGTQAPLPFGEKAGKVSASQWPRTFFDQKVLVDRVLQGRIHPWAPVVSSLLSAAGFTVMSQAPSVHRAPRAESGVGAPDEKLVDTADADI